MKVFIFIKDDNSFDDFYVYKTKEIAEYYYNQLGSDRFSYSIKEVDLLEE
jgi:hypothetical protein